MEQPEADKGLVNKQLLLFLVRRKSCIVKEMEKMKNKREEKRAQNSEIRIKRAQVTPGKHGRELLHRHP